MSGAVNVLRGIVEGSGVKCLVELPGGAFHQFGGDAPDFKVKFHDARLLSRSFDELGFAEAYINGEIDIEGDIREVFKLRQRIRDRIPLPLWLQFISNLLRGETRVNQAAIRAHYQYGDDFYLSFMDKNYRFYSHGIYHHENETLEEGAEHKVENMFNKLGLKPGMRLLDIGAGWGAVEQYCGSRGVQVTGLTIGDDSKRFIDELIRVQQLPCRVLQEDFLEHRPDAPYDAIVIFGVIEHIPNYRKFSSQVWHCLKPGGLLYLDASASVEKFDVSPFARKYIWPGTHTYLCLQDLVRELLYRGLEVMEVENESAHYGRTMYLWAERLEENKEMIVARWGEKLFRTFQLYLWGGAETFPEMLQAYHLVARRGATPRARPGWLRRSLAWIDR
ncbi:MAG: class I SAM-dependent methyltransferase [Burkholderiales bacterium]|nr:class I SAM-dependent methyltransferase [Burkholderiales bacterium]